MTAPLLPLFRFPVGKRAGKPTPAALLLGASHADAHAWRGPLAALGEANVPAERAHLPGTLVIGAVAGLSLSPSQPLVAPSRAASRSA